MITRKKFLKCGAAAVISVGLAPSSATAFENEQEQLIGSGPFGYWHGFASVPDGYYLKGMRVRMEAPIDGDDTALNGVELLCLRWGVWRPGELFRVMVHEGFWGGWRADKLLPDFCYAVGMSLRIEETRANQDDTCLNGIRLVYRDQRNDDLGKITVDDGYWGNWGPEWSAPRGSQLTGVSARMENPIRGGDDTAMNGLKVKYGFKPSPYRQTTPGAT